MTLKCKTETVHVVEVNDLEQFIRQTLGHKYECVPYEEWSNDEQHRFEIDGKLSEWEQKDWNAFKSTGNTSMFRLRTILEGLCADGQLAPGIYLINVSW